MAIAHISASIPTSNNQLGQDIVNWVSTQEQAAQMGLKLISLLNQYSSGGTDFSALTTKLGLSSADVTIIYNAINGWKASAYTAGGGSLIDQLRNIED